MGGGARRYAIALAKPGGMGQNAGMDERPEERQHWAELEARRAAPWLFNGYTPTPTVTYIPPEEPTADCGVYRGAGFSITLPGEAPQHSYCVLRGNGEPASAEETDAFGPAASQRAAAAIGSMNAGFARPFLAPWLTITNARVDGLLAKVRASTLARIRALGVPVVDTAGRVAFYAPVGEVVNMLQEFHTVQGFSTRTFDHQTRVTGRTVFALRKNGPQRPALVRLRDEIPPRGYVRPGGRPSEYVAIIPERERQPLDALHRLAYTEAAAKLMDGCYHPDALDVAKQWEAEHGPYNCGDCGAQEARPGDPPTPGCEQAGGVEPEGPPVWFVTADDLRASRGRTAKTFGTAERMGWSTYEEDE